MSTPSYLQLLRALQALESTANVETACRFCAWLDVQALDDMSTRERIDLFQEGINGYDDEFDVARALLDVDTGGQSVKRWLQARVHEFLHL